jgi:hypothetical protein
LAAANAAVAAVKKGCQLYKDIKGAAGDVKAVLDDLHQQIAGKNLTREQKVKYEAEKERVKEIARTDPNDVIGQLGDHLGKFFDALDQIEQLYYEEEKKAKQVYKGDVSTSRRALQRVLILSRLDALQAVLREIMVYQTPPELGDLWTRFEKMRSQIGKEQEAARKEEDRKQKIADYKRSLRVAKWKQRAVYVVAVLLIVIEIWALLITAAMTRRF